MTDDGTMILNEEIVKKAGLTQQQINYQVSQVRSDIRQRSLLYHGDSRRFRYHRADGDHRG